MKKSQFLTSLNRRKFLKNSIIAATGASLPISLASCLEDELDFKPKGEFGFFQGVASFDPAQDSVILWTRYTPAINERKPELILDVSTDMDFGSLVASETVIIDVDNDNTVYVDVSNLFSNSKYYYRFRNERSGATSMTGETITLPAPGEKNEIKLAVVSCANYQSGLFNVYGAVAESEADVVIHLGDYIYEYGIGEYGTNETTVPLGRQHKPEGELFTLDDYRTRYRQYRGDKQLQKAHRLKPFICVWDDHEVANDAYIDGAENHQPNEGDFNTRKLNAIQAWHEYLPARVDENANIYRSFEFGEIAKLMMLDTRIIGRDKQLDYNEYFTQAGFDQVTFFQDWQDQQRTLLGADQLSWLVSELGSSNAAWQVLGTQVLMGKYFIPVELLSLVAQISSSGTASPDLLLQYNTLVTELLTIKARIANGDPTVTEEEKSRVNTVLPYNLDAWDGYPVERETIYAVATGKKLLSLAGDTHNAWFARLSDFNGNKVGAEFAAPSVSSPGFEGIFGTDPTVIGGLEQSNVALIDDLIYNDASQRGYTLVSISAAEAKCDWRFVGTIASQDTSTTSDYSATES
jgi:alkaline phosphatase D